VGDAHYHGDDHSPHKAAIHKEGHGYVAARADGEIGGVGDGVEGQVQCRYQRHIGGDVTHRVGGVVYKREEGRDDRHYDRGDGGAYDREGEQLPRRVPRLFDIACAELRAHDNRDG